MSASTCRRRDLLVAGGAVAAALSCRRFAAARQAAPPSTDLHAILQRMAPADKVGQLLMAYLEPATMEEKIARYRCGSLLVWENNLGVVGPEELCDLNNRAQALSLEHRSLPLWLHGFSPGLGFAPGWLAHAARLTEKPDHLPQWCSTHWLKAGERTGGGKRRRAS